MKKIEPDSERYGNLVRASFFADYMELLALRGHRARLASLRDLIGDNLSRKREILFDPSRVVDDDWEPSDYADAAWTCMEQRAAAMGDRYPFVVAAKHLTLLDGVDVVRSPYVAVLAISLAHAFSTDSETDVEALFEEVVGDAMEGAGLAVGRLGSLSRSHRGSFPDALRAVGEVLGIAVDPDAAVRRLSANDEDVDLIGHLDWRAARRGRWLYIGQATCGRSDSWRQKASEPVPSMWQKFLGELTPPIPFLAVPHHVEEAAMEYVCYNGVRVLDRTHIVNTLPASYSVVQEVVRRVLDAELQTFAV